jgi:hypothetical protein
MKMPSGPINYGMFTEKAGFRISDRLGNVPQTFVHATFIGAAIEIKAALQQIRCVLFSVL